MFVEVCVQNNDRYVKWAYTNCFRASIKKAYAEDNLDR